MSLLSQNVIPGNHGKTLEQTRWKKTMARNNKKKPVRIRRIVDIILNTGVFLEGTHLPPNEIRFRH
jgi:hypothetical protein